MKCLFIFFRGTATCSVHRGPPREAEIDGAKVTSVTSEHIVYKMKKSKAVVVHVY